MRNPIFLFLSAFRGLPACLRLHGFYLHTKGKEKINKIVLFETQMFHLRRIFTCHSNSSYLQLNSFVEPNHQQTEFNSHYAYAAPTFKNIHKTSFYFSILVLKV